MRSRGRRLLLSTVVLSLAIGACGGPDATPAPTPVPTPTPSPDPHLSEPVSVDLLIARLGQAGIAITTNNASVGKDGEPRKTVNATYEGWPLRLSEYSSSAVLVARTGFDPTAPPAAGDPMYVLVGLNIEIGYGPVLHGPGDATPPPDQRAAALALARALEPLIGPIGQVSLAPLPLPTLPPVPGASPSVAPPSGAGTPPPAGGSSPSP